MHALIPSRVGVASQKPQIVNFKRGFLAGLTDSRILQSLSIIHKTTRQGPAMRRVLSLDQYDAALNLDNYIDRRKRIPVLLDLGSA
jgi:cytochrome c553